MNEMRENAMLKESPMNFMPDIEQTATANESKSPKMTSDGYDASLNSTDRLVTGTEWMKFITKHLKPISNGMKKTEESSKDHDDFPFNVLLGTNMMSKLASRIRPEEDDEKTLTPQISDIEKMARKENSQQEMPRFSQADVLNSNLGENNVFQLFKPIIPARNVNDKEDELKKTVEKKDSWLTAEVDLGPMGILTLEIGDYLSDQMYLDVDINAREQPAANNASNNNSEFDSLISKDTLMDALSVLKGTGQGLSESNLSQGNIDKLRSWLNRVTGHTQAGHTESVLSQDETPNPPFQVHLSFSSPVNKTMLVKLSNILKTNTSGASSPNLVKPLINLNVTSGRVAAKANSSDAAKRSRLTQAYYYYHRLGQQAQSQERNRMGFLSDESLSNQLKQERSPQDDASGVINLWKVIPTLNLNFDNETRNSLYNESSLRSFMKNAISFWNSALRQVDSGDQDRDVTQHRTGHRPPLPPHELTAPPGARENSLGPQVGPLEAYTRPLEAYTRPLEAYARPLEAPVSPLEAYIDPLDKLIKPLEAFINQSRTHVNFLIEKNRLAKAYSNSSKTQPTPAATNTESPIPSIPPQAIYGDNPAARPNASTVNHPRNLRDLAVAYPYHLPPSAPSEDQLLAWMLHGMKADRDLRGDGAQIGRDRGGDQQAVWDRNREQQAIWDRNREQQAIWDRNRNQQGVWDRNREQQTIWDRNRNQQAIWDRNREQQAIWDSNRDQQAAWDRNKEHQVDWDSNRDQQAVWDRSKDQNAAWHRNRDQQAAWDRNMNQQTAWDRNRDHQAAWDRNRDQQTAWDRNRKQEGVLDRNRNDPWDTGRDNNYSRDRNRDNKAALDKNTEQLAILDREMKQQAIWNRNIPHQVILDWTKEQQAIWDRERHRGSVGEGRGDRRADGERRRDFEGKSGRLYAERKQNSHVPPAGGKRLQSGGDSESLKNGRDKEILKNGRDKEILKNGGDREILKSIIEREILKNGGDKRDLDNSGNVADFKNGGKRGNLTNDRSIDLDNYGDKANLKGDRAREGRQEEGDKNDHKDTLDGRDHKSNIDLSNYSIFIDKHEAYQTRKDRAGDLEAGGVHGDQQVYQNSLGDPFVVVEAPDLSRHSSKSP
ncbi:uncharacterized protein [Procambarus clarkii]|uniref:uncharacterized protein n=1 Tax=Procambarus clarkii TaxID=6728 RepID=UPI001E670503|nr:uncharacterized protein LOC123762262 [Procambarus clarkii]